MARKTVGKRYIGLVVILAMAALSWWMQQEEQALETRLEERDGVVDYAMRDFEITSMGEDGQPRHRVRAAKLIHYSHDDSAELQQPYVWLYQDDGLPWTLYSDVAKVYEGGNVVLLEGEVHLRRPQEDTENYIEMNTRNLWIYSEQEYAESYEEVVIRDANSITRAQGVKIDLKDGHMQLLSNVRGEYGTIR